MKLMGELARRGVMGFKPPNLLYFFLFFSTVNSYYFVKMIWQKTRTLEKKSSPNPHLFLPINLEMRAKSPYIFSRNDPNPPPTQSKIPETATDETKWFIPDFVRLVMMYGSSE